MFRTYKCSFKNLLDEGKNYDLVKDKICENNRKSIVLLCEISIVIFTALILLGIMNIGVERKDIPIFLITVLYAVGVYLLVKIPKKQTYAATMIATYLAMGAVCVYGLMISYRSPEQYTVTFIAMMCIMSMTFVDRIVRIGIAHIVVTSICVSMIWVHKSEEIRVADLINVLSLSAMAFVGGFYTVNMKIHGYVMDKIQEENLEKGRQKLNAKEMEASQLLTAIKTTYDMIVSVNLTKNTYKLIGDESFVTQGDAIEGNFDEVIEIHAAKVVEEHRQLYRNTFSRESLLKAYAEGKKEVYLEYQQCDDEGIPHWLGTHTMFLADRHSTDITEITISQNIDERVRKEEETKAVLEAERDKAEQARKAKTDFLFQMSHDIRTPMNAIIGFTNFIKSSDDLYTIHNDYALKLEIASQQLLMLINDALEMSRIESGKLVFHRQEQDICAMISNVIEVMKIQAEEKGVTLSADYSVVHPRVKCDQNHMNRVVMNLLSNAVKFTHSGGQVKVSLTEQPESPEGYTSFVLKIADTGIGMSPEFLKRIFDPFEREQTSTVSGIQGTGLGLAIVKRIVDTAGDRISVESKQGEGTVFTLNITLLRVEEKKMCDKENAVADLFSVEQMSVYFKGKRILLVEDNEFNLTIAQILLENAGLTVETAVNGQIAVNKVAAAPVPDYYDAVLMDVQMPIMNGYEAARAIREMGDGRANTIIIAVTANAFDTDIDNALNAGMNGHIAKPIDVSALYRTLWNVLKR